MGKAGKLRKRRRLEQQLDFTGKFNGVGGGGGGAATAADGPQASSSAHSSGGAAAGSLPLTLFGGAAAAQSGALSLLTPTEISITVRTLALLASRPDLYKGKDCRPIRVAVNQLINSGKSIGFHLGTTLAGKVSDAVHDQNWQDAILFLAEMREKKIVPKLGSLQRWVRDCDAAGGIDGKSYNLQVLRVLDSVLRTVDPEQVQADGRAGHDAGAAAGPQLPDDSVHPLIWHPAFVARPSLPKDSVPRTNVPTDPAAYNEETFKVLLFEKGPERQPPNQHDMILYTSVPGAIKLEQGREKLVKKVIIPDVPGAFMLMDVLSLDECRQIITAAETFGFMPDQPIGAGVASDSVSVLAHNFFWLADSDLNDTIFNRCHKHLPDRMGGDGPVVGVNPRWRVFRYQHGSVYRPHVDGAWPASGLSSDGKYLYDAHNGDRWSRMTFLVYLNEDFEGGATTFFLPSKRVGVLDARPVKPRAGCILFFPHGDTTGSLLHEGSAVMPGGSKYVIRTDLMYMVEKHKPANNQVAAAAAVADTDKAAGEEISDK